MSAFGKGARYVDVDGTFFALVPTTINHGGFSIFLYGGDFGVAWSKKDLDQDHVGIQLASEGSSSASDPVDRVGAWMDAAETFRALAAECDRAAARSGGGA